MTHISSSPVLRWSVVAALLAIAGLHVALVPEHLREAPYAAALFIALSAAATVTAVLLAVSAHRLVWCSAGGLSAAALSAYFISRSIGLPSMSDDVGDWLNPLGIAAMACEMAAVICCLASRRDAYRRWKSLRLMA